MIEITNEDCMDLMKRYPNKHFDLAITDPPYGIGFDGENPSMSEGLKKDGSKRFIKTWRNPKEKGYIRKNWDNEIPKDEYFKELFRVSKKQIICGGNYFDLPKTGGWIIWDKCVSMPSLSKCELLWTSFLNHTEIFKFLWAGYRKAEVVNRQHPTQKPIALYKWLLINYAKPGDKILDTHLGSGSIAIACKDLRFDLTACEIDEDYFEAAKKRIDEHFIQEALF